MANSIHGLPFARCCRILRLKIAMFAYCIVDPGGGTPSNINVIYTSLKSTLVGYNSVADNTGLSSIRAAGFSSQSQICEITRNSEKIRSYRSSRSWKVIDLDTIESAYATSY